MGKLDGKVALLAGSGRSILRAAQPVIRQLSKAEAGKRVMRKVVNISSGAGIFGNAGQVNYSVAKAGIIGMTETLAKEWGCMSVTVNCVAFGLIKIDIEGRQIKSGVNPNILAMMEMLIPFGRAGTPEEAADAVYLFCIPESDYLSGQVLMCAGGLTGV